MKGKAADEAVNAVAGLAVRRAIRLRVLAARDLLAAALADLSPELDEDDDLTPMAGEFARLKIETEAALEFVQGGPRTLEELQLGPNGEAFPSERASNDCGYEYHPIVEQTNNPAVDTAVLENASNIIRIPTLLHEAISAEHSKESTVDESMTAREWLRTQPYDVQREWGLKIIRNLNILK